ncbi:MAG: thermopsin family protease [Thermoplasmata archaeon]|nr:thermopsin family protease [Thermoplasmata archaeon]
MNATVRPGSLSSAVIVAASLLVLLVPPACASVVGASATSAPTSATEQSAFAHLAHGGKAERALASISAAHVASRYAYLPNFQGGGKLANGTVKPLFTTAPAPMGLADFGLHRNLTGVTVGTVTRTPSVRGTASFSSSNVFYLDDDAPRAFGLQLNTVDANVTVLGNSSESFWDQNVVFYSTDTHVLQFIDNVWNFSSPASFLPANSILRGNGTVVAPTYYFATGPTFREPLPFTVSLYTNTTVLNNDSVAFFNYTLTNSTGHTVSGSYDEVVFNSASNHSAQALTPAPSYEISGRSLTPTGYLLYDAELVLGGPGGGSTTQFLGLGGSLALQLWNSTSHRFNDVPSAFGFGTDTGETASGVAEWWSPPPNPVAHLNAGPSLLENLWNTTGGLAGTHPVQFLLNPGNSFLLVSPGPRFNASLAEWAPPNPSGPVTVVSLPPGVYSYAVELSGYRPLNGTFNNVTGVVPIALIRDSSVGVYTPLIAWGTGQVANLSLSGNGTPANPYLLPHNETRPIDPSFARTNDFTFPEFPGILLANSAASVRLVSAPSFEVWLDPHDASVLAANVLPATNNLQLQFFNSSNVTLEGSSGITGWFYGPYLAGFPVANVLFWNSSHNLVASNRFLSTGSPLLFYGGTANTVWGNVFLPVSPTNFLYLSPAFDAGDPGADGLTLFSSGNLVYNNYFGSGLAVPANTPPVDILTGIPVVQTDIWNVSAAPANVIRTVNGMNLSGSIVGGTVQGGNYWGNYGSPGNPYGRLPYTDSRAISSGGDYLPLTPSPLYTVTFEASPVAAGIAWSVDLNGTVNSTTGSGSVQFEVPSGSYGYSVSGVPWLDPAGRTGVATVSAANLLILLPIQPPTVASFPVTFAASGLPAGEPWSVLVNSQRLGGVATALGVSLANGSYPFVAAAANFSSGPAGSVDVAGGPVVVSVTFLPLPGTLAVSLLPASGQLSVDGVAWTLLGGAASASVAAGLHSVVASAPGYLSFSTNLSVPANGSRSLAISLLAAPVASPPIYHNTTSGPSAALLWSLAIGLIAVAFAILLGAFLLTRQPPKGPSPSASVPVEPWKEGAPTGPPRQHASSVGR